MLLNYLYEYVYHSNIYDNIQFIIRWLKLLEISWIPSYTHTDRLLHSITTVNMAEESDAKSKRVVAKRQYTRAENNLKEVLSQEDIPIATVERSHAELNKKWSDVQDTHDYYISFISDEDQDLMASEEKWMNEIEVRFSKIEIEFDKHMEKRNK